MCPLSQKGESLSLILPLLIFYLVCHSFFFQRLPKKQLFLFDRRPFPQPSLISPSKAPFPDDGVFFPCSIEFLSASVSFEVQSSSLPFPGVVVFPPFAGRQKPSSPAKMFQALLVLPKVFSLLGVRLFDPFTWRPPAF